MVIMDGAVVIVKDFFLYGFIGVTRFGAEVVVVAGGLFTYRRGNVGKWEVFG